MSLLKVNEVQNYNGSSLTLTASTVSTSAQLNTGGNISVTGSINVSDDSTTRSNLGLGSIATQASDNIAVTGGTATLGALTVSGSDSGDLVRITQTGSGNALVVEDSANPDSSPFVVDASGNVGVGTSSPSYNIDAKGSTGIAVQRDTDTDRLILQWDGITSYANASSAYNNIKFISQNNSGSVERMRIDSSGDVLVGTTSSIGTGKLAVKNDSTDAIDIRVDGSWWGINQFNYNAGSQPFQAFRYGTTLIGSISGNNTSTTFSTSSDYRLKENITEITDGISRVKQLNPSRFNFIADPNTTVDGFIAHEVFDIVPEAVSGEKDAVNEDGSIDPQGIDQSKLVPLLTAALQESIALIESQQSQINALIARIEALETT